MGIIVVRTSAALGMTLSRYNFNLYNRLKRVLVFQKMGCSFTLVGALLAVLFVNQPKFMKHEFY
jgi:hypothetical protein